MSGVGSVQVKTEGTKPRIYLPQALAQASENAALKSRSAVIGSLFSPLLDRLILPEIARYVHGPFFLGSTDHRNLFRGSEAAVKSRGGNFATFEFARLPPGRRLALAVQGVFIPAALDRGLQVRSVLIWTAGDHISSEAFWTIHTMSNPKHNLVPVRLWPDCHQKWSFTIPT